MCATPLGAGFSLLLVAFLRQDSFIQDRVLLSRGTNDISHLLIT